MTELSPTRPAMRDGWASVRLSRLAEQQWGVVTRSQLADLGLTRSSIARWVERGRLHRLHPGVFAVGHRSISSEARLAAALFYGGRGCALSHMTAARRWNLLVAEPRAVHVSSPSRQRSRPGVVVHHPRQLEVVRYRGFPVTPFARTLLDIAALVPHAQLRRAVAEAEFRGVLDLGSVEVALARGRRGSAVLRDALERHRPQLAQTLSVLEERFLALCEGAGLPFPAVNATVCGLMVDALWSEHRLIVELDGRRAHSTVAQMERDRERDLALRTAGYTVLRYTWYQVTELPERVIADLRLALIRGRP